MSLFGSTCWKSILDVSIIQALELRLGDFAKNLITFSATETLFDKCGIHALKVYHYNEFADTGYPALDTNPIAPVFSIQLLTLSVNVGRPASFLFSKVVKFDHFKTRVVKSLPCA